jgi:uridine kinase
MIGEEKVRKSNPIIIGIAGPSGSGKSTLVRNLAKLLEDSEIMFYDDYNPNYTKLTNDLGELRNGKLISYPVNNRIVQPRKYIVIEEPTGRKRPGMENRIDYLVFIKLPLEVSFARVLLRSIEQSNDQSIDLFYETIGPQFKPKFSEKPSKILHIIHWQLRMYLEQHRDIYLRDNEIISKNADLILDGMKSKEEITQEVIDNFTEWLENRKRSP